MCGCWFALHKRCGFATTKLGSGRIGGEGMGAGHGERGFGGQPSAGKVRCLPRLFAYCAALVRQSSKSGCRAGALFLRRKGRSIMLSRLLFAGTLAAFGFGLASSASAGPQQKAPIGQGARTAITTAYARMDKALVHGDVSAYTSYLLPTFVGVYPQGNKIQGKDKDAASLHQLFAMAKTVTSSTQLLSCSLQNGGAVVTTRESFSMSGMHESEPIAMKSVGTLRGFWVKAGGRWLLKEEHTLADTTTLNGEETKTINGQPIPPAT